MEFSQYERNSSKRFTGLIVVVLLHIFVIYALVTGLARQMVEVIQHPLETKIIEEVKPPPPPDTPPPPPPPTLVAPPPPFIPPPEVSIQQPPPVATISSVTNVAPEKAQAFVRSTKQEATGPSVVTAAIVDLESCKPDYPPKSLANEETGTTTVSFLIGLDGRVIESRIDKSSGFRNLDNAARSALSLCKFKPGTVDGKLQQSWTTKHYKWVLP